MRDSLRVREIQRVRGLHGDIDNLGQCHSTADPRQKGLSFDVLHDDEGNAIALANVVDGGHIRMVQRGSGLRFAREALHAVRVRRELSGQDFQRDGPVQPWIAREVDLSHSPRTEQRQNLIVTDGSADECRLKRRTRRRGRDVHGRPLQECLGLGRVREQLLNLAAQPFVIAACRLDECGTFRRVDIQSRLMDAFDRRPMVHHRLVHVGLPDARSGPASPRCTIPSSVIEGAIRPKKLSCRRIPTANPPSSSERGARATDLPSTD